MVIWWKMGISCYIYCNTHTNLHSSTESWEHEKTGWMTHGMVSSSLIWPRFPSLSCSWLNEFFLKSAWFLVMSPLTGASAVQDSPSTPSWHRNLASLFPAPHPEFTNAYVTPSCEHLHKSPIMTGTASTGHCIHVTGKGEQGMCWSQMFSWVLFRKQEIFTKSSLKYFECNSLDIY